MSGDIDHEIDLKVAQYIIHQNGEIERLKAELAALPERIAVAIETAGKMEQSCHAGTTTRWTDAAALVRLSAKQLALNRRPDAGKRANQSDDGAANDGNSAS